MSINLYSKLEDSPSPLRPRRRSIQATRTKLPDFHTIQQDASASLTQREHCGDVFSCPKISLPPSVMKELESAVSRHPVRTIRLDRRLYNREKERASGLENWSLEGRVWRKPKGNVTVEQIVNQLDSRRKSNKKSKDLSLDLYSRMINSFKNNYKSARKAFEIKEQVSLKSLSKFERKYLPSKLISNYVPFTLTSTVQHPSPKNKSSSVSIVKAKAIKPTTLVLQTNQEQNKQKKDFKALSPRGTTQLDLKLGTKTDQKPWRTNSKFPKISATIEEPGPPKRNFTPWHRVSQADEDISQYV